MKVIQLATLTLLAVITQALSMETGPALDRSKPRFHDYRTKEREKLLQEISEAQKNIDYLALIIKSNLTTLPEYCRMVEGMANLSRKNSEIAKELLAKKDN